MAKSCDVCNRGVMTGNNVSHSNRKTKRIWAVNVQKIKILNKDGVAVSAHVCTRCIRSAKIERSF